MKRILIVVGIFIISCITFEAESQNYSAVSRMSDKISLTGDGTWDYLSLDSVNRRLFVTHSTMVQVIDLKTKKQVGIIENLKNVHGVAFAYHLNKGFISNGKDSTVIVFELNSLKVTDKVKVTGKNPDAIVFDTSTDRVFTFNSGSNTATVLDGMSNKVIGSIFLDGKPKSAVSDGKGKVYVNIENLFLVDVINSDSLKIEARWSVTPADTPGGLAIDGLNRRLFVGCGNSKMVIMDADLGNVIQTLNTDYGTEGVAWDPILKRVYSANGNGTLTIIQEISKDRYTVLNNVNTQKGARTIALDFNTHCIYIPAADYGPPPKLSIDNTRQRPSIIPGSFHVLEFTNTGK